MEHEQFCRQEVMVGHWKGTVREFGELLMGVFCRAGTRLEGAICCSATAGCCAGWTFNGFGRGEVVGILLRQFFDKCQFNV